MSQSQCLWRNVDLWLVGMVRRANYGEMRRHFPQQLVIATIKKTVDFLIVSFLLAPCFEATRFVIQAVFWITSHMETFVDHHNAWMLMLILPWPAPPLNSSAAREASDPIRSTLPPLLYFYYLAVLYNAKLYFIPCCIHKQSEKSLVNHVLQ